MAKYSTYEVKGEKESFESLISNISPTDTPFSAITSEKTIKNKTHQWQEDSIAAVVSDPKVEGWTAADTTKTPTVLRSNITQIFGKDGMVTDSNDAQDKYGRAEELNYQKTLDVMAVKRDIEYAYVGTGQTQVVGDASTAREMDGMQAQIDVGNVDSVAAVLTEERVQALAGIVYAEGGEINCLMANPVHANVIAGFSGKATATNPTNQIDNLSTKTNGWVETYVTQLGQVLSVKYNRFMKADEILLLDTAKIKRLNFRALRTVDLAKTGSSSHYMVEAECSLMNMNQKAHGLITGIT
ncbi:MAG: hypothetical protein DRP93_00230 [Candidatus Neomarinimicrobiota bacterium]|nr:MAG: hypothetical protein DRP93_00230 [Candidatus Neomarinimicrobiota bacterium]